MKHWEHIVGVLGLLMVVYGHWTGLFVVPSERMMGEAGRILYVHVPAAWAAMLAFIACFVAALGALFTSRRGWDSLVEATAEVGVVMGALLLALGAIFAKPTWGVWWDWDPRLTASAVMVVTYVGVLLLRSLLDDPDKRLTWSAVSSILAFVNIPVTYYAVRWWRTLHQMQSTQSTMNPEMRETMFFNAGALCLVMLWMIVVRWRIAQAHAEAERPAPLDLGDGRIVEAS